MQLKEKLYTGRGMLPEKSRIYDSLGLVEPFMFEAQKLIQRLCKGNLKWNEDIRNSIKRKFQNWKIQLIYLCFIDEKGIIHCTLVMAKSRFAPIKYVTIPRLELMTVVLPTKMSREK